MVAYVIMRVAESSREQRRSSQRDDDAA